MTVLQAAAIFAVPILLLTTFYIVTLKLIGHPGPAIDFLCRELLCAA